MGCDIHMFCEKQDNFGNYQYVPMNLDALENRNYFWFAFLANVRNDMGVPFISAPRWLPSDISDDVVRRYALQVEDSHSASWLSIEEIMNYGYNFTLMDYLGRRFFDEISKLRGAGIERIVFWFDN